MWIIAAIVIFILAITIVFAWYIALIKPEQTKDGQALCSKCKHPLSYSEDEALIKMDDGIIIPCPNCGKLVKISKEN